MVDKKTVAHAGGKPDKHDIQKIGEYLVAAELHKKGFKVGILSGTLKDFDILVHDPKLNKHVGVEARTQQTSRKMTPPTGCFTKPPERTNYPIIFVIVNFEVDGKRFFIIPSDVIRKRQITGTDDNYPKWKGTYWINRDDYVEFENRWDLLWEESVE